MSIKDDTSKTLSASENPQNAQSTVIIGAGIIGCATAYYLANSGRTRPDSIHLIESSPELFQSASGKSGGFLAPDWFGPATLELGALSFALHKELAEQNDGREQWAYCKSTGASLVPDGKLDGPRGDDWLRQGGSRAEVAGDHGYLRDNDAPEWLARKEGDVLERSSENGGVAQVDSLKLCQFLMRENISKGVHLHQPARVSQLSCNDSNELSAVHVRYADGSEHNIPCTRILLAAGAWTAQVFKQLFPTSSIDLPISSLAGHSLLVKSPRWSRQHATNGCHAVFSTGICGFSPEVFSRLDEVIYLAGLNDFTLPLPDSPEKAQIDPKCIASLREAATWLLGNGEDNASDLEIVRESLCYRPVTDRGVPILTKLADETLGGLKTKQSTDGVFVAAGHGPWGISQSLGTGKVMQELIEGVALSANIDGLGL